ncbi:MAG: DUF2179 domain-containing protein [Phycisphaerae bacterium]|nr:DUF2179 domain-containing protein [Phycisphaerae bacterium]
MTDSGIYQWVLLPLMIFAARVLDVSLGTVRLVFVARGYKCLAPVMGFFEVLIWITVIGQIMNNLSNPACYIGYAGGFATGNYVGMWLAERLSLGNAMIRVITQKDASELMASLTASDFGVTVLPGQGVQGQVSVLFTIVPRRRITEVIDKVKQFNPNAFYTIEEVASVRSGVFPAKKYPSFNNITRFFRPFRKGK